MIDEILADSEDRMKKTVEAVQRELAGIRTGHAHVGLVDHVRVEYFGPMMPVNQMATVAAPEARLLTIQPWDRRRLAAIEKALLKSDLGLTPSNDGADDPPRHPAADRAAPQGPDQDGPHAHRGRTRRRAQRPPRRLEHVKRLVTSKEISEDDQRRAQDQLQKLTDSTSPRSTQRGKEKEAELMEV